MPGEPAPPDRSLPASLILKWALAVAVVAVSGYLLAGRAFVGDSDSAEAELNRSLRACQTGQFHEAITAARAALRLKPGYAPAYNNLAMAHLGLHMYDDAIRDAEEALRIQPDYELAKNNLAWIQREKAKSTGTPAVPPASPARPGTADYYLDESLRNYSAGRFQESIDSARQVLKIDPDNAAAYNNLAAGYASLGKWDDAIENAEKALKLKPDFQLAINNLNWALRGKAEQFRTQRK